MAARNSITPLAPPPVASDALHAHVLVAYLRVARTAVERAQRVASCPDVQHLLRHTYSNLAAAHDLVETDRGQAA